MPKNKSAVFTLTSQTDDYLDLFGVRFDAKEFTLREAETLRLAYEDEDVINNPLKQGELLYSFLEPRIQPEYEMFSKEFFLDNVSMSNLGKLARFFGTGEVTNRKN